MIWLQRLTGPVARTVYVILALFAAFLFGQRRGAWDAKVEDRAPEVAQPTDSSDEWREEMRQLQLSVKALTEAQALALATKYQKPEIIYVQGSPGAPGKDGRDAVLAETETSQPAPAGVSILTTADPKTGEVTNTVVANKEPFLTAPLKLRFYLEGGVEEMKMEQWRAEAGVEFRALRRGSAEIQPKVSLGYFPLQTEIGVEHDTRLFTGVRVTFEKR